MFGHMPQCHLEVFEPNGKSICSEYFTFTDSVMNLAWSWRRSRPDVRIMIDGKEHCKPITR
jgi:hypothetical protein